MNRAFSVSHPKHAQPSCPTPYIRLVPVPSDQAFPTLQQLLILPSIHSSSQLSVHSCSPFVPYDSLSVRIVHSLFIPYESLSVRIVSSSVRIVHGFFILYESSTTLPFCTNLLPYESSSVRIVSLSVRFVIRAIRYLTVHVYLSFFVWSFLLALPRAIDEIT